MSSYAAVPDEARKHAILSGIGFLVLLPIGILIPRYARTFTDKWFYFHVAFQFLFAGPIIMAGFAYGYKATTNTVNSGGGVTAFSDPHMNTGLIIFILYFVQLTLGTFSHFVKVPSHRYTLYRSPQQYLHIALGLGIIGMAFYQVRLGYTYEWIMFIATEPPASVDHAWMAMAIIIPILYVFGFALFPRQLAQEAARREERLKAHVTKEAI